MIAALLKGLVLKVFPSMGHKGVIDTQITIYQRLKKKFPRVTENDLLNALIMSRVNAPPRVAGKDEELTHYRPFLEKEGKSLEEVILAIVEYEYSSSRKQALLDPLTQMDFSQDHVLQEIERAKSEARAYIRQRVATL